MKEDRRITALRNWSNDPWSSGEDLLKRYQGSWTLDFIDLSFALQDLRSTLYTEIERLWKNVFRTKW